MKISKQKVWKVS